MAAPTVVEILESRTYSESAGTLSGRRVFKVYPVGQPDQALNAAGVPAYGASFPGRPALVASTRTADPDPAGGSIALVTVEYVGIPGVQTQDPEQPPNTVGLVTIQFKASAVFDEAWRVMPGLTINPPDGTVDNQAWVDIGGTPADIAGEPLTFLRRQASLVVSEVIDASDFNPNQLFLYVGRRNQRAFLNFAAGTLVYNGPSGVLEFSNNIIRIDHEFLADEFRHLRQIPVRYASGDVVLKKLPIQPGFPDRFVAEAVAWRQPFPNLAQFDNIGIYF